MNIYSNHNFIKYNMPDTYDLSYDYYYCEKCNCKFAIPSIKYVLLYQWLSYGQFTDSHINYHWIKFDYTLSCDELVIQSIIE